MKNIHVIPTTPNDETAKGVWIKETRDWCHIYITSNSEGIEEGDWIIDLVRNEISKANGLSNEDINLVLDGGSFATINQCKKIILTTDQDLIKEGIQAIDDDFLNWFVGNPSCEEVKILRCPIEGIYTLDIPKEEPKYPIGGYAPGNYMCYCVTCKIEFQGDKRACQCEPCAVAMTKEEPKQELELKDFDNSDILDVLNMGNIEYLGNGDIIYNPNLFFVKRGDKWFIKTEKPKQETLEEAADKANGYNLYAKQTKAPLFNEGFIEGVKWQQERMYSEEDVDRLISIIEWYDNESDVRPDSEFMWFEQFKKK